MMLETLLTDDIYVRILTILIPAFLTFLAGMFATGSTVINSGKQVKISAEEKFRQDLLSNINELQDNIDKLNADVTVLKDKNNIIQEKNLDLRELLTAEKEKVIQLQGENTRLKQQVLNLQDDRVRHANRIIIMEDEIRSLRSNIEQLKKDKVNV